MKTLLATLLLVVSFGDHASASLPPTAQQTAFVNAFVAAMHAKDEHGLMALMHPKDRPCVTDKTRAFYQYIVTQQSGGFPKQKVNEISVTTVGAKDEPSLWQFLPEKNVSVSCVADGQDPNQFRLRARWISWARRARGSGERGEMVLGDGVSDG